MTNLKFLKTTISAVALSLALYESARAADTGSCGTNCTYNYDPTTQTLTFTGTGANGAGVISKSTHDYGLSGTVKNTIVSEGITDILYDYGSYPYGRSALRDIGASDGKLVLPQSLRNLGPDSMHLLRFGTIEINSKNLQADNYNFRFLGQEVTIVMSEDANFNFNTNSFYPNGNNTAYASKLNILCKGNPDNCKAKFGNSLDAMDQSTINLEYYKEYDKKGNLLLQYNNDGYDEYDAKGNIIAKYDTNGNLRYVKDVNGAEYTYDKNGNLSKATKRGPFTIPEANALTKDGPVNTVTITW